MAIKNVVFEVSANTKDAETKLNALIATLEKLQQSAKIPVQLDTTKLKADIQKIKVELSAVQSGQNVKLLGDITDVNIKLQQIIDLIAKTNRQAKINIDGDTTALKNKIADLEAQIKKLKEQKITPQVDTNPGVLGVLKLRNAFNNAGLALGLTGAAAVIAEVGKESIRAAANYEQLTIAFTTFLGSAEKGKALIQELRQIAVETPFTPEEILQSSRILLGYGIQAKDVTDQIRQLGDIAAGTGAPLERLSVAFGQITAAGRLYGQDLLQLINAGFNPLLEISQVTGKSIGQLKEEMADGAISVDIVREAFKRATSEGGRFFGLTQALADSTTGQLARLEESWQNIKITIGQGLIPVFLAVVKSIEAVFKGFQALPQLIRENRAAFLLLSTAVIYYTTAKFRQQQVDALATAKKYAAIVAAKLEAAAYAVANKVLDFRDSLNLKNVKSTSLLTVATNGAKTAQEGLNLAIKNNPIGFFITLLTTVISYLVLFKNEANEVKEDFIDLQEAFANVREESAANTEKELSNLDRLFNALKKTTEGSKERQAVIDEINSKYGITLKNLENEKKFVDQTAEAYEKLRQQITQTARVRAIENQLTQQFEQQSKQQTQLVDNLAKFILARSKQEQILGKQFSFEELKKAFINEAEGIGLSTDILNQAIDRANELNGKIELPRQYLELNKYWLAVKEDIEESNNNLLDTRKTINALEGELEGIDLSLLFDTPTTGGDGGNAAKQQADLYLDLANRIKKNNEDLRKQQIQFIEPLSLQGQIKAIEDLEAIQKEAIDREIDREIQAAREKGILTGLIETQFEKIRTQEKEKVEIENQKDINAKLLAERRKYLEKTIEQARSRESILTDINETRLEADILFLNEQFEVLTEEREKLQEAYEKSINDKERALIKRRLAANLALVKKNLQEELDLNIANIKKKAEQEANNPPLVVVEQQAFRKSVFLKADLEILKARKDFNEKIKKLDEEGTDVTITESEKRTDQVFADIQKITNAIFDLTRAIIDSQLIQTEAQISAQEERIEAAKSIAEKGNADILELEQKRLDDLERQRAKYVRQVQNLAVIEVAANSAIAIAQAAVAGKGYASAVTIAATLIAMAAGFAQARAQAQSAVAGFEKGGYTGDGGRKQEAGVVHKGEFVINAEKTKKYRPLLEAIHLGRNPNLLKDINQNLVVINNKSTDEKLSKIEKAIREQSGLNLSIDERGIHGIVSTIQFKEQRLRNRLK
jgi:tape measure domain-containing protein